MSLGSQQAPLSPPLATKLGLVTSLSPILCRAPQNPYTLHCYLLSPQYSSPRLPKSPSYNSLATTSSNLGLQDQGSEEKPQDQFEAKKKEGRRS
ncbi:hypothetical protein Tco_1487044 [Tanacetum coccineum]